jgi:hypothetical protein
MSLVSQRIRRLTAHREPCGNNANGGSPWKLIGGFTLTGSDVAFLTGATRLEIEEAEYLEIIIRPDWIGSRGLRAEYLTPSTHFVNEPKLFLDAGGEIVAISDAIKLHWDGELKGPYMVESRLISKVESKS